ncbi:2-amino-4-hydroxy-6-hydroxymethyldihydropteridine diphosphokinase [Cellvibrio mixtus]|uniref:2-amino-4-hydroxy-6-hydroxymethyldihydropteridine pyrophosphokinase n=1 Tax=Cellvibrio mixtus TaxID=39650 RepID=A0A266QBN6_9GAMM|nr:2-amino-4-hydroxy-6-hydroxymethyldihydropteridine diphosphokinase [Cellvibrio mixtus]OZY87046.1 2-amino-4-hydroxy-6-hydroxymethyldihydropteridine diphosphokinase [Cellvibrio mixtus]
MALAYIGLGSNLDDPLAQVMRAIDELSALPQTQLAQCSAIYSSKPIGPEQPDFINAVALLDTHLAPLVLLDALQAIEQAHQRVRIQHWGPRTLDLDLLLYGDQVIATERLTVPHPYLTQRGFVLYPLADITPDLQLPDGSRLPDWLHQCPPDGLVKLPSASEC